MFLGVTESKNFNFPSKFSMYLTLPNWNPPPCKNWFKRSNFFSVLEKKVTGNSESRQNFQSKWPMTFYGRWRGGERKRRCVLLQLSITLDFNLKIHVKYANINEKKWEHTSDRNEYTVAYPHINSFFICKNMLIL